MKAVIKMEGGAGHIICTEVAKPRVGAGKVLIKVAAAGICGTDLKIQSGDFPCNPPVVLGHEYSGIVEEVGKGVIGVEPGDKVISETAGIVCGKCEFCMSGEYLMCDERLSIGYGVDGAMAEYICVREEIVHKVPQGISLEEAALCEPAAVAFHAVFDCAEIKPFHTVLITGPGTIGQLAAQMVKSTGAQVILAGTKKDAYRLEIAEHLGIDTVMSDQTDLMGYVEKKTKGELVDYAFECSGAGAAISGALSCLRKKGMLVQVGLTKDSLIVDYGLIPMKQIQIRGAFGHLNRDWIGVLKMVEKKQIDVKPLITHKYSLNNWQEAFAQAENLDCLKVLLHP